jgi:hypothetical protein
MATRLVRGVLLALAALLPAHSAPAGAAGGDLPPNPLIVSLLEQVSPDSLLARLETLVAFGTRHTNSDTTSSVTGIGAARNWVLRRFQDYAAAAAGPMVPEFFEFDELVCAVSGHHKNVLATQPGAVEPDRFFLVSGHLDSRMEDNCDAVSPAPGADDDGSGVALVLEMARILSQIELDASMVYMAFTGEEQGLVGSSAYAEFAETEGRRIDGMLTNDIVGNIVGCADPACPPEEPVITDSTSVRHFSRGPSTDAHRQLTRAMKLAGLRYLPEFTVNLIPRQDRPGRSGDHVPFGNRGFPAARFTEANEFGDGSGTNGHQHNGTDLIEFTNVNYLARVVRLNIAGFANLALAPESPEPPAAANIGDGTLRLTWPSVTTAPDVAGYRVAVRSTDPDSLFYDRVVDAGLDPGPTQEADVTGLDPDVPVYLSVSAYDTDFNESRFSVEVEATPVVAVDGSEPDAWGDALGLDATNPAGGAVGIRYAVPRPSRLTIDVLDVSGRRIAVLLDRDVSAGAGRTGWDGANAGGRAAGPGVYWVRMRLDGRSVGVIKVAWME